jgi:CubicO group peptidase (beta-lactamase class C family)
MFGSPAGVASAALVFVLASGSFATATLGQVSADTGSRDHPALTAADVETFLEGVVPLALKTNDIVGAVVSIVKDGQLLFAKGYGFADLARRLPVRPDSTLFRVASISKLFTAIAAMQLVEQGKLDLDRDLDDYLDFKLPRRFSDKITLRHLLTHTAGFQEQFKQRPAERGQSVPLAEVAHQMTPDQIYRPGTITSYSNYGADLAGYLVEQVSGVPYPEYVRRFILEPLGMAHSSIAHPLPPNLLRLVSRGYQTPADTAIDFEVLQGEPSGNLSATATDMAKFAIALLDSGSYSGGRLLDPETLALMAATQFRTHPNVAGMGLGFFEEHRNGVRIIGHGGDLSAFHSHLSLLLDHGVGIFVSVNSAGRGAALFGAREAIRNGILDRYFPRADPVEPVVGNAKIVAKGVTGSYTLSRRGETTLARIVGALLDLAVTANDDGSVQISLLTGANRQPVRWYPIDSTTFRTEDGSERIGYVAGANGLPDRIALFGGHELHRVGAVDGRGFTIMLFGAVVTIFAGSLLLWPIAALIRRRYRLAPVEDGVPIRLRATTRVVAALALAFFIGLGLFMSKTFAGVISPDSRSDPLLGAIRLVGVVAALGTVPSVLALRQSFVRGRNAWARVKYLALVGAGLAFTWSAIHWNLLALSTKY